MIVHWKLDWRLYIESPRHRCLIDFHCIALWPIQFTALPDKQNKAYKQPYKQTLTFLFPFFPPLKRGDLVLLPPLELHVQRRSATTSKGHGHVSSFPATHLLPHSLLFLSFVRLQYCQHRILYARYPPFHVLINRALRLLDDLSPSTRG